MNPIAVDIKNILVEKNIGVFAGTGGRFGIFVFEEPDKPDNTITIRTGVTTFSKPYDPTIPEVQKNSFQIRVRGTAYLIAYDKILEIEKVLNRIGRFVEGGAQYANVFKIDDPLPLKKDTNDRLIWTQNYNAVRKEILDA